MRPEIRYKAHRKHAIKHKNETPVRGNSKQARISDDVGDQTPRPDPVRFAIFQASGLGEEAALHPDITRNK